MRKANWFSKFLFAVVILSMLIIIPFGCQTAEKVEPKEELKEAEGEVVIDFPNKTIYWELGVSAGGGFDRIARMLVPFWEKHLPGNATIVIRNSPGAEWLIAHNACYKANPDGYTLTFLNIPGNLVTQVVGLAEFDFRDFTYIGRISTEPYVAVLSPSSKYKTLEDLKNGVNIIGSTDVLSSTAGLGLILTAEAMGIDMVPIPHGGSTEATLAAVRGDADWTQFPYASIVHLIDAKELIPILVFNEERLPELPDVPTVIEAGHPELLETVRITRIVATSPGVPEGVTQILRDSFLKAVNDPEFIEIMENSEYPVVPSSGEEAANIIADGLAHLEQYKDVLLEYRD